MTHSDIIGITDIIYTCNQWHARNTAISKVFEADDIMWYWQDTSDFKPYDFYNILFSYHRIDCKYDLQKISQVT